MKKKPKYSPKSEKKIDAPKSFSRKVKDDKVPLPRFKKIEVMNAETGIRLNKYIANSGVCSRRDADKLIEKGEIQVNGVVVTELGMKVSATDKVVYKGEKLIPVIDPIYILMNKPKDTITTTNDPEGRKTVMDLIEGSFEERLYPVGRLDRNTTGVLLLTNDGELAQRLTHPKRVVQKVYVAELDKPITDADITKLVTGVELEDGIMVVDKAAMPSPKQRNVVGLEIHSGRNRIIHRTFEALGYKVLKLDRVLFANLDKRRINRGEWRTLTSKELKSLRTSLGLI
jgi:23S rRNA pseudouridine2605 synthase